MYPEGAVAEGGEGFSHYRPAFRCASRTSRRARVRALIFALTSGLSLHGGQANGSIPEGL